MTSSSDMNMENFFDAVTVAVQHEDDIEPLMNQAPDSNEEIDSIVGLIQTVHSTLVTVEPSNKFASDLHDELLGIRPMRVVSTVRQMPARVHFAAILAVVAGFFLIAYRRLMGSEPAQDITEEPVTA